MYAVSAKMKCFLKTEIYYFLQHCKLCHEPLTTIHHCRKCGEGFCDACSDATMPVPERGWGDEPVRVCKNCLQSRKNLEEQAEGMVVVHVVFPFNYAL